MKIIQHSEFICEIHYEFFFQWKGSTPGHGIAFRCDKNGVIDMAELETRPAALSNYNSCLNGTHDVLPGVLKNWEHNYRQPAIGECNCCGCEVVLDSWTNTCDCGIDYNGSGQQLAPRRFWGEETGETFADLQDL